MKELNKIINKRILTPKLWTLFLTQNFTFACNGYHRICLIFALNISDKPLFIVPTVQ